MNKAEKLFLMFFIVTANTLPKGGLQFASAFAFLMLVGAIFIFAKNYDEE